MNRAELGPTLQLPIATSDGEFVAHYSAQGLASLNFPIRGGNRTVVVTGSPQKVSLEVRRWHQETARALKRVLTGRDAGPLPPLDWSSGTDFQRAVWTAMQKINPGQTRSYGEIARDIGRPKAVRAVGGACGANPIPVLVPCHRVLAAHHKIGGFSGGLDWKQTLLQREGVLLG